MPRITRSTKSWSPGNPTILANTHNTSGWKKLRLLLWKNYKIQIRHNIQTFVELFIPLLFTIVLVIVRDVVVAEVVSTPTTYNTIDLNYPPHVVRFVCSELYYTPKNEATDKLMSQVVQKYFRRDRLDYKLTGFNTMDQLIKSYEKLAQEATLLAKNDSDIAVSVLAGIVFTNEFNPDDKSLPKNIKYTLRFPAQQRTEFDIISERFGIKPAWFTEIVFPLFQYLGPRSRFNDEGGLPGYEKEGFLYLQHAIDMTLLELLLDEQDFKTYSEYDIRLQRFPYPPFLEDKYLFALQGWLPLLIMLSFIYPAINITKSIVYEKEKRLKESMKMMGLPNYLHWLAWFIKSITFLLISLVVMTILTKAKFSSGQNLSVLPNVDGTVFFFILFVFTFQVISFSFFISTLCSSANAGATVAGVFWFVLFIPYFFIQPRYNILSRGVKLASCTLTNLPIALACQILCMFEGTGVGMQWSTMMQGSGPDDNYSMFDCILMMAVNATLFLLLALYIEGVWPGEYGVPLPWYFPLSKSYWRSSGRVVDSLESSPKKIDVRSSHFQAEPIGKAGIRIIGLSKNFEKKWAVKDVQLNMYENQITALLGHNGAGKTTTMSMLTGLFPPSSGTAIINNYDIRTDIRSVRSSLGICPQHDVLFDELTVEEHLRFFCLMKGFPDELVETEITRMITSLGLQPKRHAQSHTLSGGMKRKLSVGIALCGGSKVVLLDEPTSGMDPGARRSTWDLIQTEKKNRTILLSTHFMEEADLLGDRIAIMAEGQLQCVGSSLFLKKKYGGGYHLIIVKESGCEVENITNLLKTRIPDVEVDQNVGAELSYSLPDDKSSYFAEMFTELEARKAELKIASYGASITTMEEVFIRVGREADKKIAEEFERTHSIEEVENGRAKQIQVSVASVNGSKSNLYSRDNTKRNSGLTLIAQQFRAMLVKKIIYSVRNRVLLLGQMGIPLFYLVLILGILSTLPGLADPPALVMNLDRYENIGRTVTPVHCDDSSIFCQSYKQFVSQNFRISVLDGNETFINQILTLQAEDLPRINFRYIAGFEERPSEENPGKTELVAFFNNQPFHSPPLAFNYLMNAILHASTNYSIEITNHPFPYSNLDSVKQTGTLYSVGFQVGYNIGFGMATLAATFVVFLITEREVRSKHLQFVSGLKFPVFWLATYIVDLILCIIPCILLCGILLIFKIEDFYRFDMQIYLIMLFGYYCAGVIPYMYLWSYCFTIPASGFTRMAIFNIFTGMATMLTVVITQIPELQITHVGDILNNIFLIFPNYALGMGIVDLSTNYILQKQCQIEFSGDLYCDVKSSYENPCCTRVQPNYLDWRSKGIGKNLFALALMGVISTVLLLLHDSKLLTKIFCFWRKQKDVLDDSDDTEAKVLTPVPVITNSNNELGDLPEEELAVEDVDVTAECERIRKSDVKKLFESDNLILRDLTKLYGKFLAVDKLNLGVQGGQTFGLLGVNGAGKTTTFKMLTGDIAVSAGDAYIHSHSVRREIKQVHSNLGYCPQFDGVIGEMTGRETVRMFARLRGIPEGDIDDLADDLAASLIFTKHLDKQVRNYSGGNKRKLSTAMALIGNPPIVFLDEPTTGMDPVARRHLWNAISSVRDSGTSIVLTSHSMEECEALCTRLAIMVNGKFRCLGSPQHLKNKFGEGYTLIAQAAPADLGEGFDRAKQESGRRRSSSMILRKIKSAQKWEKDLDGLRNFIEDNFPSSILKDIHPGFVHYHVLPSPDVTWGQMFEKMELAKERYNLDAYSVGQTSLEQVFLNFTKAQLNIDESSGRAKKTILGKLSSILTGDNGNSS